MNDPLGTLPPHRVDVGFACGERNHRFAKHDRWHGFLCHANGGAQPVSADRPVCWQATDDLRAMPLRPGSVWPDRGCGPSRAGTPGVSAMYPSWMGPCVEAISTVKIMILGKSSATRSTAYVYDCHGAGGAWFRVIELRLKREWIAGAICRERDRDGDQWIEHYPGRQRSQPVSSLVAAGENRRVCAAKFSDRRGECAEGL